MSDCVFLGPTLPVDRAREVFRAWYLPPIARGDLPRAVAAGARRILIVDGVFGAQRAVTVTEIRDALVSGVEIWGAASMGALRAAEAAALGMRGVGRIYELYRQNAIADDEVALMFAAESWIRLSEPLISIRAALGFAEQRGWISATEHGAGLERVKPLHYSERTLGAALWAVSQAHRRRRVIDHLEVARAEWDVKRRDALAALAQFGKEAALACAARGC
jgi:hypothetical protein